MRTAINCPVCGNSTEPVIAENRDGTASKILAREACAECEGTGRLYPCSAGVADDCAAHAPADHLDADGRCAACAWMYDAVAA